MTERKIITIDEEALTKLEKQVSAHSDYIARLQSSAVKTNLDTNDLMREVALLRDIHCVESGFIYVASPYTSPDPEVVHDRYLGVMYYTMELLRLRKWAYSPIVHCHEMSRIHMLPTDAMYWMDYNYAMLAAARELHVLCLPGWNKSVGVTGEIAFWRNSKLSQPVFVER